MDNQEQMGNGHVIGLRNKKTGEVISLQDYTIRSLSTQITIEEDANNQNIWFYSSLSELYDEWEDM